MKRVIVSLMFLTIVLSGCVNTRFLASPDDFADELYGEVDQIFEFNHGDFPYTPLGCWHQLLCTTPGNLSLDYDFEPEQGFPYIMTRMSGYGFGLLAVVDSYLGYYFVNEMIVDESLGNHLDEWFLKLEDQGVKYYISKVDGINSLSTAEKMTIRPSMVCVIDMDYDSMEVDIEKYLQGKDSETIDWLEFINNYNCMPNLQVYVNKQNLKQAGVTIEELRKDSKQYYNQKLMNVTIEYPDFSEDAKIDNYYYADSTTKSQAYSKDSMLGYEPKYNWL